MGRYSPHDRKEAEIHRKEKARGQLSFHSKISVAHFIPQILTSKNRTDPIIPSIYESVRRLSKPLRVFVCAHVCACVCVCVYVRTRMCVHVRVRVYMLLECMKEKLFLPITIPKTEKS